jgi:carbamoyltransferase
VAVARRAGGGWGLRDSMVWSLGISAFFHDAAAALVRDGEVIAAAQEERFTRVKHDPSFPISAITYCLEEADIDGSALDAVVFYEKPLLAWERMVESFCQAGLQGFHGWRAAAPQWIAEKLHVRRIITDSLGVPDNRVFFIPHHLSHAAAAFYPSPFRSAAILTVDGVGEWATASVGYGEDRHVTLIREMRYPDSLGLLYSAITYFCGFKVNSSEYKLMGLAPYGTPRYLDTILAELAEIAEDGTVRLNPAYFEYLGGARMTSRAMDRLFGGPRRQPESRITRREMDLAASIQVLLERAMLAMARHAKAMTGNRNLCLAGGVALNCVANGMLLRSGEFDEIWIQPAAGDAGSALGAALAVQHGLMNVPRSIHEPLDGQKGSLLGPRFSRDEILAFLENREIPYVELALNRWADSVAETLAAGGVVGFFHGRMEFGPRALGARSILGDPRRPDMQQVMNLRIKHRESFRPFAPAVLAEDVGQFFDLDRPSPYMLLVADVRERLRRPRERNWSGEDDLLAAVNQVRSDLPAVTHWDYSARVQTVHKETNPLFHAVLSAFKARTGIGVLINTSFNVRGEPIVCTPDDAYRCFMNTDIDHLFLEGFWLDKKAQPPLPDGGAYSSQFELD